MEMIQTIVEFIERAGYAIVLMAYFLVKDWKFNQSLLGLMGEIKEVLARINAQSDTET